MSTQHSGNEHLMEIVRKRIQNRGEEEVFLLLQGLPFAVRTPDGRLTDPWHLTEEERQQWMREVYAAMSEIRQEARLVEFTKAWARLDQKHRHHLIDDHPQFFNPIRADCLKSMTDADCMWLRDLEDWQIADFLTDNSPIHGLRPPLSVGDLQRDAAPLPSPASKMAA